METLAWIELLVGFLGIFLIFTSFRTYQLFKFWRNSFYTEIYSSFIEFLFRRKSLKRMSTSYWLNNELGEHRIMLQMAHSQDKKSLQAYIIIALSSGIYFLQIKNFKGKIEGDNDQHFQLKRKNSTSKDNTKKIDIITIANPLKEVSEFTYRWNKLMAVNSPIYQIIVFSDLCQFEIDPLLTKSIITINRNAMFQTIKDLHQKSLAKNSVNVDEIYTKFITTF